MWPDVVVYIQDGVEHAHPPRNNKAYRILVKDTEKYEELARSGLLYDSRHTLREAGEMIDNRATIK